MNRDNTPTFNVNRKVVNFKDFSANPNAEKEELKKMDRQNIPNSDEHQKNMANSRYKFNNTTRKMDDLSPAEIEDKIDAIEELEGTNEEFFGGAPGVCNISIEGEGLVKKYVVDAVQKALRNIGGEVNLTVDGKDIDSRGYDDRPSGMSW
jgi:hypothetical protein